jgi:hypothetical protein
MRKSLWIIPVLYVTLVVPNAKADPITVNYDFECCNLAPGTAKVTDLMVVFNAPVGADAGVDFGEAFGCDKVISTGLFNAIEVICTTITPGDHIDLTGIRSAASILSASWSAAGGKFYKATPIPEPATGGLMLLGFGMLMLKRIAQKSRRATCTTRSQSLPAHH